MGDMRWVVLACMVGASVGASGCFTGGDALGLACDGPHQCGIGQQCLTGVCGGPTATTEGSTSVSTTNASTGSSEGGSSSTGVDDGSGSGSSSTTAADGCAPVTVPQCQGGPVASPTIASYVFSHAELGNASSAVVWDWSGDGVDDLAVLDFVGWDVTLLRADADQQWARLTNIDRTLTGVDNPYDMAIADLDGDGDPQLVLVSIDAGQMGVVEWSEGAFGAPLTTGIATTGLFSMALADVHGDACPELLAAGNGVVVVVSNVGGSLFGNPTASFMGDVTEPWEVFVWGQGSDARVLVPSTHDDSFDGLGMHPVHVLRVPQDEPITLTPASPSVLATNFRNPWAVAGGDFDGDGMEELAVVERNLTEANEGTDVAGRLRFFRVVATDVEELVPGGIAVGVGPRELLATDLDCDGRSDLVVGTTGAPMQGGAPQVLFGAATLDAMTPIDVAVPDVSVGNRMAVGDFDDDGRPEVVIPDYGRSDALPSNRIVVVEAVAG